MTDINMIKEYQHWNVQLHSRQAYLGRCVIWYTADESTEDLFAIPTEHRDELWQIVEELQQALGTLFQPDRYNYSSLWNVEPHLHVHLIPRYKTVRVYAGLQFEDKSWGANPYVAEDKGEVTTEIKQKLIEDIKTTINK